MGAPTTGAPGRSETNQQPIPPQDLMGAAEVLSAVGWKTRRSIHEAMTGPSRFPQPAARLIGGNVWDGRAVQAWIRNRKKEKA